MNQAMSDLEKYMNSDDSLDPLIQIALIHYQFETIHPFLDGNGRIGRLLITLFLMEKQLLTTPALYISYFLKLNRTEYYDRMRQVRAKGDYEQWIRFFLEAGIWSADDAMAAIDELSALHDKNIALIQQMGRASKNTMKLFRYLEASPIIELQKTTSDIRLSYNTVSNAARRLETAGILKPSGSSRNRT